MTVEEINEEHNKKIEEINKHMQELNIEHKRKARNGFITLLLVSIVEVPFAIASALGFLRFMPLHLASCVICAFCTGMAYQRYFDAKHRVDITYQ